MSPPRGYVTALRGDLGEELATVTTRREFPVPDMGTDRLPRPDPGMLSRILQRIDEA